MTANQKEKASTKNLTTKTLFPGLLKTKWKKAAYNKTNQRININATEDEAYENINENRPIKIAYMYFLVLIPLIKSNNAMGKNA
ncbi:MAG: hypothetical protein ACD_32C00074G0002 [uncultured bacterium]|nr:MAG: hypothetical protein ACD_32C00074G0002 [uncultured bacterium]